MRTKLFSHVKVTRCIRIYVLFCAEFYCVHRLKCPNDLLRVALASKHAVKQDLTPLVFTSNLLTMLYGFIL